MEQDSLRSTLARARVSAQPVTAGLVTGHQIAVVISACGSDWVSGEMREKEPIGVVIPLRSIAEMWCEANSPDPLGTPKLSDISLRAVLGNLVMLRKHVRLHTLSRTWNGVITHVAEDYLTLHGKHSSAVMIPLGAVGWVSIR